MKKLPALSRSIIFFFLLSILITACQKIDKSTAASKDANLTENTKQAGLQNSLFYDSKKDQRYNLSDPAQLNQLAVQLAEDGNMDLVEAHFGELSDSKGSFSAISATYQSAKQYTKMVIPLSIENGMYQVDGCIMKCSGATGKDCNQQIIERCKSQKVASLSGKSPVSSSILFY